MATKRTVRRKLAALALAGLGSLILGEVALRVTGFRYPCFYRADAERGWSLRPGAAGLYSREGRGHVRVNSHGMRGPDHLADKPPGVARLLVLGDSYTAAFEVEEEETFCARLEARIDPTLFGAESVEVWNSGVPGYGTAQQWLTLQAAMEYEPDAVLVVATPGNDVRNNVRSLEPARDRPFFRLEGDELTLDDSFRGAARYLLRSGLYGLAASTRLGELAYRFRSEGQRGTARASEARGERGLDAAIYFEPEGEWVAAWEVTERLLSQMRAECDRAEVFFGLVTVSAGIQVHPEPARREEFRKGLGVRDLFEAERQFQALAERQGFPVLVLAPALAARAATEGAHYHGFEGQSLGSGHWNAAGHAAAADLVEEWLEVHLRRP